MSVQTVRMYYPWEEGKAGDIHPDEVENMKKAGWRVVDATETTADDFSDDELISIIESAVGYSLHHKTRGSRKALVRMFNELDENAEAMPDAIEAEIDSDAEEDEERL